MDKIKHVVVVLIISKLERWIQHNLVQFLTMSIQELCSQHYLTLGCYAYSVGFVGSVCRTKTMHRLLCFGSKFSNHFAFTLGHCLLFLAIFCLVYLMWMFNIMLYIVNYSFSLKCTENI